MPLNIFINLFAHAYIYNIKYIYIYMLYSEYIHIEMGICMLSSVSIFAAFNVYSFLEKLPRNCYFWCTMNDTISDENI